MEKTDIYGFKNRSNFIKISFANQASLNYCKRILENGICFENFPFNKYSTYESNIPLVMKFMVDLQIYGMNWVQVDRESCNTFLVKDTTIYIETKCSSIKSFAPIDEWSMMAPLKILSFDIECVSKKSYFPKAEFDPVIAISCVVKIFGDNSTCDNRIFCLKGCEPIPGTTISSFDSEYFLLKGFHEYFKRIDPDIIIGYNILNFDFPYLITRAAVLGYSEFAYLGRLQSNFKFNFRYSFQIERLIFFFKSLWYKRKQNIE